MRFGPIAACIALLACDTLIDAEGPTWIRAPNDGVPSWGQVAVYDARRDRMVASAATASIQKRKRSFKEAPRNEMISARSISERSNGRRSPRPNPPGPRTDLAGVLDTSNDRFVIVGGRVGFAASIDEVWGYSFAIVDVVSAPERAARAPRRPRRDRRNAHVGLRRRGRVPPIARRFLGARLRDRHVATNARRRNASLGAHVGRARLLRGRALLERRTRRDRACNATRGDTISAPKRGRSSSLRRSSIAGAHFGYAMDAKCCDADVLRAATTSTTTTSRSRRARPLRLAALRDRRDLEPPARRAITRR